MRLKSPKNYSLDYLQRLALAGIFFMSVITFVGANLHAVLWQSSEWLVSTVLPSVVVNLTNQERATVASAPLRRSAVLDEAARLKAEHMAQNQYFAHFAPDGTSPWYWFDQAGYVYAHAGENLAIHFTDSEQVVRAWMNSPTHRANIVSGKFTEIGVGTARGRYQGYDTVYVVQLFGTPAAQPIVKTTTPERLAEAEVVSPAPSASAVLAVSEEVVSTEQTATESPTLVTEPETVPETAVQTVPEVETDPIVIVPPSALEEEVITQADEVVRLETELVSTSSGLLAASVEDVSAQRDIKGTITGLVTRPHTVLQIIYTLFGVVVLGLLLASLVLEAKQTRYVQVAYSIGLLAVMAGLWFVHTTLTEGVVIV